MNKAWTLNEYHLGTQWTKLGHRLNILRALSARSTGTECPIYMLLLGQYNLTFTDSTFAPVFLNKKNTKMGILWYFCETSMILLVNLSKKSHFFYITIYQVNTILFSLKMRLWDFFLKNNYARKWYYSRSCDCFRMKYKERGWGLQIPRGKWSNIFWQRIANPPERLTEDLLIENPPERLAEDFLIVRWTNNATQKRAVFWFKSTITTI